MNGLMNGSNTSYSCPEEILIVDDLPENLKILAALLRREGYGVRCATSGAMALRSAQLFPPRLILLDIMMPEMDGYEVCRQLKGNPATAKVPVIFVSALDTASQNERVSAIGGIGYITKPYQLQDLLIKVQRTLTQAVQCRA